MAGYTRTDTTNNIADGNIINATDLDNEFDGIQAAFNSSTGHNHDGTTGEGAPILVLGPTQDVVVSASTVTPKTTNTVDIGSSSLKFKDLHMAGNALVGGTLGVTGVATFTAQPVLSSLTASSAVATDASKGLVSVTNTGTGNNVLATSPTLVTPILGTPTSATLTNATGLPVATGISGLGTGVATALAVNVGSAGAPVLFNGALGTPSSGTVTNLTGTASININGTVGATTASTGAFSTLSATGVTTVQAGSAAAPAITTTGDTNTGIFFPAADTIAFAEGGAEAMRIDSSANVGIGIQAFSSTRLLVKTAGTSNIGTINAASYGSNALVGITDSGAETLLGIAGSPVAFYTAATERMRIDSSGNVGIGTSSPAAKLSVDSGAAALLGNFNSTNASGGYLRFQNSGTTIGDFGAGGNLFSGGVAGDFGLTSRAGNLVFGTSSTERMRIDSSGNVGIGTSSPSEKLHVSGNLLASNMYFGAATGSAGALASDSGSSGGTIVLWGSTSPGAGQIEIATAASAPVIFKTSNTERARIDSSGNLLVGTTSAASGGKVVINQGSGYLLTATGGTLTGSQAWRHWLGNTGTSSYFIINDANTGVYLAYGGTSWTANSDERLKDIIEPIADAANKVSSLRAVIGKYKADKEGTRRSFLIAQDVQAVLPEAVSVGIDDMLGIQYTEVIPLLVAAIKEQQAIITALTARVAALESN
jgi:hypothetical protein